MGAERIALHADVKRRGNATAPKEQACCQRPWEAVSPAAIVVARCGSNGVDRPGNHTTSGWGSHGSRHAPPRMYEAVHAGKAEQENADIEGEENQEDLGGKPRL